MGSLCAPSALKDDDHLDDDKEYDEIILNLVPCLTDWLYFLSSTIFFFNWDNWTGFLFTRHQSPAFLSNRYHFALKIFYYLLLIDVKKQGLNGAIKACNYERSKHESRKSKTSRKTGFINEKATLLGRSANVAKSKHKQCSHHKVHFCSYNQQKRTSKPKLLVVRTYISVNSANATLLNQVMYFAGMIDGNLAGYFDVVDVFVWGNMCQMFSDRNNGMFLHNKRDFVS